MNIIGLDIGGTKCALSVPDGPNRVREVVRFATTDLGVIVRQTGKFIRFAAARPGRTKAVSAWDGSDAETEPQMT